MKIHKTMTMKERKALGYAGYLERSLCNQRVFAAWCTPVPFLSRYWKKVNCPKCIKKAK